MSPNTCWIVLALQTGTPVWFDSGKDSVCTGVRRPEPEERAEKSSSGSNEVSQLSNLGSGNGLMGRDAKKTQVPGRGRGDREGQRTNSSQWRVTASILVKSNIQKMCSHKWSGHMLMRLKGKQHRRSKVSRWEAHQATVLVRKAASSKYRYSKHPRTGLWPLAFPYAKLLFSLTLLISHQHRHNQNDHFEMQSWLHQSKDIYPLLLSQSC